VSEVHQRLGVCNFPGGFRILRIIRHGFVIILTTLESSGVSQVFMFRPSLLEADIDLEVDAIVGERFHADAAGQQRVLQIEADVGVEGVGEVRLVPCGYEKRTALGIYGMTGREEKKDEITR
jgi:hypothetical protein